MIESSVGEQELALLRHVADRDGSTAGEVAESFGADRGLARSTVLTMMERLRQKRLLVRQRVNGVFRYRARASSATLLRGIVQRFVRGHLGGSVTPLLAYLSETHDLSESEVAELGAIVSRLQAGRRKKR